MGAGWGIFNDEGMIEDGFRSEAEAMVAIETYDPDDDVHVAEICHDHPDQERHNCEHCIDDDDAENDVDSEEDS